MKIVFIANLSFNSSFLFELVDLLNKSGNKVVVYDFINSKKYLPETNETISFNPFFCAKYFIRVPYFRRYLIPVINKLIIAKEFKNIDIVNIHYVYDSYGKFIDLIKRNSSMLITTFWGSDLLRASKERLIKYKKLLDLSDKISMVPGIQSNFSKIYPEYKKKIYTSYFGLSVLNIIELVDDKSIQTFKAEYSISGDLIFITVGYNASSAQQHLLVLNMLKKMNRRLKSKVHLLLPLTYGGDDDYKQEIFKSLEMLNISFTIFSKFLSKDDLAILRKLSDITLNIQETDAFSGSISESIVGDNVVLVGDWLPYDIYEDWGVNIYRENLTNYLSKIIDIIENYTMYTTLIKGNREKVLAKLTWDNTLPIWLNLYINK